MRSLSWHGASSTPRRYKIVLVTVFSACILILTSNLLLLSQDSATKVPFISFGHRDYYTWETKPFIRRNELDPALAANTSTICAAFPLDQLQSIQVILKIGASEDKRKIQASLDTVNSCINDLLIFSDLPDRIGQHDVIDVLAELPPSYSLQNPDFDVYSAQREANANGERGGPGREGWRLDRFKFLPMVEKAYTMRPDKSWFLFIEADSYLSWDNLYRFLEHFNPNQPLYMGSPVPGSFGRWFAHGGSGFIISKGAVKKFLAPATAHLEGNMGLSIHDQFEKMVKDDCCGDAVLAYALIEKDITLQGYWPLFNGDNSEGMRLNTQNWCNPIISMHHIGPEEMKALWDWEMSRIQVEKPLLYADMFSFIHQQLTSTRTDWDNWSGWKTEQSNAAQSFETCRRACEAESSCIQYSFFRGECKFGKNLRHGVPRGPEGDEKFMSGWNLRKVEELRANQCQRIRWPTASVARHD